MTVYVVQNQHMLVGNELKPKFDFSSAKEFGELKMLLSPGAKPFDARPIIAELYQKLSSFSNDDYLLLVGNPCLIGLAVSVAADVNAGYVTLLQWSGKYRKYIDIEALIYDEYRKGK